MKFVATYDSTLAPEDIVRQQPGGAVAEMQLALGEAGGVAEQAGHGMRAPGGILQALTQNHVTAALAMHRPRLCEVSQSIAETQRGSKRFRMKLGIAARQPAAVGAVRRRLVGERRERQNFGTGVAPRRKQMRIDEAESSIMRQRDALPRRRDGGVACRGIERQRRGARYD